MRQSTRNIPLPSKNAPIPHCRRNDSGRKNGCISRNPPLPLEMFRTFGYNIPRKHRSPNKASRLHRRFALGKPHLQWERTQNVKKQRSPEPRTGTAGFGRRQQARRIQTGSPVKIVAHIFQALRRRRNLSARHERRSRTGTPLRCRKSISRSGGSGKNVWIEEHGSPDGFPEQ